MAGNLLVTLPVLVAFLLAQRTFIRSLTSSAVKG
jgi:multiple sugar transport system permease protein